MKFSQIVYSVLVITVSAVILLNAVSCSSSRAERFTQEQLRESDDSTTCFNKETKEVFSFKDVDVLLGTDENVVVVTERGKTVVMDKVMQEKLDCYKDISNED